MYCKINKYFHNEPELSKEEKALKAEREFTIKSNVIKIINTNIKTKSKYIHDFCYIEEYINETMIDVMGKLLLKHREMDAGDLANNAAFQFFEGYLKYRILTNSFIIMVNTNKCKEADFFKLHGEEIIGYFINAHHLGCKLATIHIYRYYHKIGNIYDNINNDKAKDASQFYFRFENSRCKFLYPFIDKDNTFKYVNDENEYENNQMTIHYCNSKKDMFKYEFNLSDYYGEFLFNNDKTIDKHCSGYVSYHIAGMLYEEYIGYKLAINDNLEKYMKHIGDYNNSNKEKITPVFLAQLSDSHRAYILKITKDRIINKYLNSISQNYYIAFKDLFHFYLEEEEYDNAKEIANLAINTCDFIKGEMYHNLGVLYCRVEDMPPALLNFNLAVEHHYYKSYEMLLKIYDKLRDQKNFDRCMHQGFAHNVKYIKNCYYAILSSQYVQYINSIKNQKKKSNQNNK